VLGFPRGRGVRSRGRGRDPPQGGGKGERRPRAPGFVPGERRGLPPLVPPRCT
jgi:hypothetical protein